jgi:serine/threonine protein kinase
MPPTSNVPSSIPPTGNGPAPFRYEKLRKHALGGTCEVWVATDKELHREVALKELKKDFADQEERRTRLRMEAEVTGRLEHPNIVPTYGLVNDATGQPFYAMRLYKEFSLQGAIDHFHSNDTGQEKRSLALRKLLGQFKVVCNAVGYAHDRCILHRDLKPANVMLGPFDQTIVVDWGEFEILDQEDGNMTATEPLWTPSYAAGSTPTQVGRSVGTPEYMSPEQADGDWKKVGPASDIYSLGVTLYHLLTGKPPFDRNDNDIVTKRKCGIFPKPQAVKSNVDSALAAICLKAMATCPKNRYAKAADLADDVERWLADEPVSVYPDPFWRQLMRWQRHHPRLTGAASMAALFVIVVLGILNVFQHERAKLLHRADENFNVAWQTMKHATDLVLAEPEKDTDLSDYRSRLQKEIIGFHLILVEQKHGDGAWDEIRGHSYKELGRLHVGHGECDEAIEAYERAAEVYGQLAQTAPVQSSYDYHREQAMCVMDLGKQHAARGQDDKARNAFRRAFAILKQAAGGSTNAKVRQDVAVIDHTLGDHLADCGDARGAADAHDRAAAVQRELAAGPLAREPAVHRELALSYLGLGRARMDSDDWQQAAKAFQDARQVQEDFQQRFKTQAAERTIDRKFRLECALTDFNLGLLYQRESTAPGAADQARRHYADQARKCYESAAEELGKLIAAYPYAQDVYREAANCYRHQALLLKEDHGQIQAAREKFAQADEKLTDLTRHYPNVAAYAAERGRNNIDWADFTVTTNVRSAVQHYLDAVGALERAKELERRTNRQRVIGHWLRDARPKLARGHEKLSQFEPAARQWARASAEAEGPQRDEYAARAVELLRRALATGLPDVARMLDDPDLAPLRGRADYAALLWDLADAAPATPPKP